MNDDVDDYGRRRQADFEYSGGVAAPQPKGIEKILLDSGMPKAEVPETATAIVKLMDRMVASPPGEQSKMVETFMGRHANPEAVAGITRLALAEVTEKHAFTLAPAEPGPAKPSAFVQAPSAPKAR